jgi:alcohol dehydrogenase class IV
MCRFVAALLDGKQDIRDVFGIGKLSGRSVHLICLPTTAGTGSEVSPNAILLDENENLKKGVISPHLMPDAFVRRSDADDRWCRPPSLRRRVRDFADPLHRGVRQQVFIR